LDDRKIDVAALPGGIDRQLLNLAEVDSRGARELVLGHPDGFMIRDVDSRKGFAPRSSFPRRGAHDEPGDPEVRCRGAYLDHEPRERWEPLINTAGTGPNQVNQLGLFCWHVLQCRGDGVPDPLELRYESLAALVDLLGTLRSWTPLVQLQPLDQPLLFRRRPACQTRRMVRA
jgi:hypothetical protein